jgi:hypothetical protein
LVCGIGTDRSIASALQLVDDVGRTAAAQMCLKGEPVTRIGLTQTLQAPVGQGDLFSFRDYLAGIASVTRPLVEIDCVLFLASRDGDEAVRLCFPGLRLQDRPRGDRGDLCRYTRERRLFSK